MATKMFIPFVLIAVVLSMFAAADAAPVIDPNSIFPNITSSDITTLSFSLSANITESEYPNYNASELTVWYYFSTPGYSDGANTSMSNVTTKRNVASVIFNATVNLDFTNNHTAPGYHTVTICANNTIGNLSCSASPGIFVIKIANITQIANSVSGATLNITYENGTSVGNEIMDPVNYNYTLRVNTTPTAFVEVVGMAINETLMQQLSNSANINTVATSAAQSTILSAGYSNTSFLWYDASSFLPSTLFYKYGRIQLPGTYHAVFYCSGASAAAAVCAKISACSNIVNLTSYSSVIGTGCYNATEVSGKTVVYVPQFSGAAGGNDTVAPTISPIVPATTLWYKTNITLSINVTDNGVGINASRVYYRIWNGTVAGGLYANWAAMSNTTPVAASTLFGVTFDITNANGNFTFEFSANDTLNNMKPSVNVTTVFIDNVNPSIAGCSGTTVAIGETPVFTCTTLTDNSQSFGGSAPTKLCPSDTTTAGTKTATCTATDLAGNTNVTTASYTVNAATTTNNTSSK
ncbi:MAG: hypothetical protein V1839_00290 [archaeon]